MANPSQINEFRNRWSSKGQLDLESNSSQDPLTKIIQDHLSDGWRKEEDNEKEIVFCTHLDDGRKWTRHYDKKTCTFICQRFYTIESLVKDMLEIEKRVDWPSGSFGD